jgi:hypothetical protein
MKRVLLVALGVAVLAGAANAQAPHDGTATLHMTFKDTVDPYAVDLLISETAIIQLWVKYEAVTPDMDRIMGMDMLFNHRVTEGHDFEVVGFNEVAPFPGASGGPAYGATGGISRFSRGQIDEAPHDGVVDALFTGVGNLNNYAFIGNVGGGWNPPVNGLEDTGGAFLLLDEIIIHGVNDTGSIDNRVAFAGGGFESKWTEMAYYSGPPTPGYKDFIQGGYLYEKANQAPGGKGLRVHVTIPEPGSLALLAFGGLAAIRRRR